VDGRGNVMMVVVVVSGGDGGRGGSTAKEASGDASPKSFATCNGCSDDSASGCDSASTNVTGSAVVATVVVVVLIVVIVLLISGGSTNVVVVEVVVESAEGIEVSSTGSSGEAGVAMPCPDCCLFRKTGS